jgi:cation:H+ antiporter
VSIVSAVAEFLGGAALVIAATEALVKGLVGVSRALRIAPFVAAAVLSGLEAENIAVGLAAGHAGLAEVALGTAYGGAIFMPRWDSAISPPATFSAPCCTSPCSTSA